jgi:Zn-dependent peptidase ImmA (M78 family)/DNA-binding XRE family transcriptional regulator
MDTFPGRIAQRRKELGLSQEELAKSIERDRTAVIRLEKGQRKVSAFELAEIAEALHTSVGYLLGRQQPAAAMAVAYRVGAAALPQHLATSRDRARRLFELEALLDGLGVLAPPRPDTPAIAPLARGSGSTQGRELAIELRRLLQLHDAPIPELPDLIESKTGVDVALEPMPDDVSGLCISVNGTFLAMVNSAFPLGRQRFTMAHELCHALCGDADEVRVESDVDEPVTVEEVRANSFACNFLLPLASLHGVRPGDLSDRDILRLMYGYGISLSALLNQLRDVGAMDSRRSDALLGDGVGHLSYVNGFRSEWTAAHRVCVGIRRPPSRLEIRCLAAYRDGVIGIGPVADLLGSDDAEVLRRQLAEEGIAPPTFTPDVEAISV